MGVYLRLAIIPNRINHDEWREIYEESLALLQAYPGEMMGIQLERINSAERRVYSRKIEHHPDDPKERHWHVVGDFKSKEQGESFVFYYDVDHYRLRETSSKNRDDEDGDIIVSIIKEKSDFRYVFSDKTQGHPYHISLLAVAMLVEDRFPQYAHASGNIDIHQAKRAQEFIKTVIQREIALPISVDTPRLLQKIHEHYLEKEAITHFQKIFRGNFKDEFETLFKISGRPAFTEWFADELRYYNSPTQLGALGLCMAWLNATKELKTLCELACLNEDGPKFDPVEFSDALASTWIGIDESVRDVMNAFRNPQGATDTVASQFGSFLFDIGGLKGRNMRFYMDEKQISATLSALFPAHAKQMEQIFKVKTENIKESLSDSRKVVEELVRRIEEEPEPGDGGSFILLKSAEKLSERQTVMLQGMACGLAKFSSKVLEKYPEIMKESPEQLKDRIVRISHNLGLTLTEDAWNWIDRENDLEILRLILPLVLINIHEQTFWNIKKALLENRELCKIVLEMTHDEELLARIDKEINAAK